MEKYVENKNRVSHILYHTYNGRSLNSFKFTTVPTAPTTANWLTHVYKIYIIIIMRNKNVSLSDTIRLNVKNVPSTVFVVTGRRKHAVESSGDISNGKFEG